MQYMGLSIGCLIWLWDNPSCSIINNEVRNGNATVHPAALSSTGMCRDYAQFTWYHSVQLRCSLRGKSTNENCGDKRSWSSNTPPMPLGWMYSVSRDSSCFVYKDAISKQTLNVPSNGFGLLTVQSCISEVGIILVSIGGSCPYVLADGWVP